MKFRWLPALLAAIVLALGTRILLTSTVEGDDALRRAEAAFSAHQLDAAEALAIAALQASPVDGRGYRVLARVALERGDAARADFLDALALRYAPRDLQARALAALSAIDRGAYGEAAGHLERILRVEPPMAESVFPLMAQVAVTPEGRQVLAARIADRPSWRPFLLANLAHSLPRAADLPPLFHAIGERAALTPEEMSGFIGRFVQEQRWTEGFLAWAAELPAARRQQFDSPIDGGFELPERSGAPFDWQLLPQEGVEVGVVTRPEGDGHALHIAFAGSRGALEVVRQLLLLQPGRRYRLHWQSRLEGLETPRGLRWLVRCASGAPYGGQGGDALLAGPSERGSYGWRAGEAAFAVPADCPAQWLALGLEMRIPSDAQAVGSAWFDDMGIMEE